MFKGGIEQTARVMRRSSFFNPTVCKNNETLILDLTFQTDELSLLLITFGIDSLF